MQVYRVEHANRGHGPYMCCHELDHETGEYLTVDAIGELSDRMSSVHNDSWSHPVVTQDVIDADDRWNTDYFCGFRTVAECNVWFDGFLEELDWLGYKLHVYDVKEELVLQGRCQLAFVRDEATLVETRNLV